MIDFNTALARLLRDGVSRDAYARDPEAVLASLPVSELDRKALAAVTPADLEIQADILLGKRYALVKLWMPRTCARTSWETFRAYARGRWRDGDLQDAAGFGRYLKEEKLEGFVAVEANLLEFLVGTSRYAVHWVGREDNAPAGIQVMWRTRERWREWFFAFRL